jgi:hypothetical protein
MLSFQVAHDNVRVMVHGGKRTGAGRPTDNKNRKNVHYRIDALTAEKFAAHCKDLRVPLNAVLEKLLAEWMSETEHAHRELKKEFFKRPCSPDNLKDLNKIRVGRRREVVVAEYLLEKGMKLCRDPKL